MPRPSAWCLWLVSVLAISGAQAQDTCRQHLTMDEAGNATFVSAWFERAKLVGPCKDALWFYEQGLRDKKRRNWSGAAKAFGESMIRFPGPRALWEYADAEIRMLAAVRAKDKSVASHILPDMRYALNFYQSALAADRALKALLPPESEELHRNSNCVAEYLASGASRSHCQPLQNYRGMP